MKKRQAIEAKAKMTEILELSENNFKVSLNKIPQGKIPQETRKNEHT